MNAIDAPICPRCLRHIPNDTSPGAYPGAGSRWDRSIEICSPCGFDEAAGRGVIPPDQWPIDLSQPPEKLNFTEKWPAP